MPTFVTKGLIGNDSVQLSKLEPAIRALLASIQNPPSPSAGTATYTVTATANTRSVVIRLDVGSMNATGVYVTIDDATAPTLFSQFTPSSFTGQSDFSVTLPLYGTDYALRAWVWDSDAGAVVQATDGNGNTSITVRATATQPASNISDFAVTAGTNSAVEIDYTFTAASIIDGVALQYDLYRTNGASGLELLESDVSTSGTYSSAIPGTAYTLVLYYYPANDAQGVNSIRANSSNTVSITTTAAASISAFSVSDVTTAGSNPDSADVSISVDSASVDQVNLKLDSSATPSSLDAGWENLSGWTNTVTGPPTWTYTKSGAIDPISTGPHTGYAYVRDATYPTSISDAASDTFDAIDSSLGSTDFTMSFAVGNASYNEEGAPTKTITITRYPTSGGTSSCDIAVQASGTDAEEGVNYWFPAQTVSFGASDATATVDLDILFDNLGYNSRTLVLVLSNPVSGGTSYIGNQSTLTITINGTYGYWANGDIDLFNPPPASALSGNPASGVLLSTSYSLDGYAYKNITVGGNSVTLENCIVDGAALSGIKANDVDGLTVRNCLIQNTNNDMSLDDGYAIISASSGSGGSNIKILANRFENVAGGFRYKAPNTASGMEFLNNYCGTKHRINAERDLGLPGGVLLSNGTRRYWGSQGQIIMFECPTYESGYNRNLASPTVTGNKSIQPPGSIYTAEDHISTFNSGCASGSPGIIKNNIVYGTAVKPYIDSGTGILIGDKCNGIGYWTCKYNTVIEAGTGGVMLGGGRNNIVSYNDIYTPQFFAGYKYYQLLGGSTNVGTYIWRVPGVNEGQFYNCTYSYNKVLYWGSDKVTGVLKRNDIYYPVPYPGGGINHGQTAEVTPTGYSTNILGAATGWDGTSASNAAGEDLVRNVKHVLNQPAIDDGVEIMYASASAAVGNGTLTVNAGASPITATWAEYGDNAGTAVDIETQSDGDERIYIYSSNGQFIRCIVDAAALPASGTHQWTVKVTRFGITEEWLPYPDMLKSTPTGRWEGDTATTPSDTAPPTVPASFSGTSASATSVTWSWDQSTDAAGTVTGYNLWVKNVTAGTGYSKIAFVADSATPSYTQTGMTEGNAYEGYVTAQDDSGNISDPSNPAQAIPTGTSYDLSNTEFDDTANWTASNCTLTAAAGIGTITNSGSAAGKIIATFTTTTETTIDYSWALRRGLTNGAANAVIAISTGSGDYTGSVATHYISLPADNSWQTGSITKTVATGTQYYVMIWCNSAEAAKTIDVDYFRLTMS